VCLSLLAAVFLPGCGLYKEYVRRGQVADSLVCRMDRLEQAQVRQYNQTTTLRADVLTQTDGLGARLDQVEASIRDLNDRLDRISRRLGLGHGSLTPQPAESTRGADAVLNPRAETTAATAESVPGGPDSALPVPADSQPLGVDPDRLYNNAYLDFTRAKYDVATAGFRQFLELFPQSEMADNALYWVGECHYSRNRLDSAEAAFSEVLERYPDGNKAPAAGYKLGLVCDALGRHADARRHLAEVVERYPGTTEARLAQDRLDSKD
jgi:tol-pal system protein YbgF